MKILLIHGLFSSPEKFYDYEQYFKKMNYQVITIKHDMPKKFWQHWKIKKLIKSMIDIDLYIGHSYGGMVLSRCGIPGDKIITINSPFVRKGYNYRASYDILNLLDLYNIAFVECVIKGDHSKIPAIKKLINNRD